MPLTIRFARREDLEALFAVESASFPPEQGADRETIRRRLSAYPGHILAAVEGDWHRGSARYSSTMAGSLEIQSAPVRLGRNFRL